MTTASQKLTPFDTPDLPMTNPLKIINQRYIVKQNLGQGGMGDVYLVEDLVRQSELCALKKINGLIANQENLLIFKQEFEYMTRLRHPNLVHVYDLGYDSINALYYITMEYIQGETLSDKIAKEQCVSTDEALSQLVTICRTINFIHSRNIIHRDIKPNNIMIDNIGLKLMDFGLAQYGTVNPKKISGTVQYIAPELLKGKIFKQSDMFALGLTFFKVLTSQSFYDKHETNEIVVLLENESKFDIYKNERLKLIDDEYVRSIIGTMTAYNPIDRYQSGNQLIKIINLQFGKNTPYETDQTKYAYVLGGSFVGREEDLLFLRNYITKNNTSQQNVLWIKGEAGVGKSRLCQEFKNFCQINTIGFIEGNCYEAINRMYGPFCAILNELLYSVQPEIIERYGTHLKRVVVDHPRLHTLMNQEPQSTSQLEHALIVKAIAQTIIDHSMSYPKGLVIYLNDMQWADTSSIEVIHKLLELLKQSVINISLSVIITSRTEPNDALDKLFLSYPTELLHIKIFSENEVGKYIEAIFGAESIGKYLRQSIPILHKKVGGNPLFLQELIKLLIDKEAIVRTEFTWDLVNPIESVGIPKKLEEMVDSRFKSLKFDENEREVLHIMSLLIRKISWNELVTIKPIQYKTISNLEILEIIKAEQTIEHTLFSIKHDLIRSIILKQLSSDDYIRIHELIAVGLEKVHSHEIDRFTEDIAYHYEHAKNTDKTIEYLEKLAKAVMQNSEYTKTLEVISKLESIQNPNEIKKHINYIDRKITTYYRMSNWDRMIKENERLLLLSQTHDFPYFEAKAYMFFVICLRMQKDTSGIVLNYFQKAITISETIDNKHMISLIYNIMGDYFFEVMNDYKRAQECHQKGIAIAQQIGDDETFAANLGNMNRIIFAQGDIDTALANNAKVLEITTRYDDKHDICYGLEMNIVYLLSKNDFNAATIEAEKLLALSEKIESLYHKAFANLYLSEILFCQKKFDIAKKYCAKVISLKPETIDSEIKFKSDILWAKILYATGEPLKAQELLTLSVKTLVQDAEKALVYYELYAMNGSEEYRLNALRSYTEAFKKTPFFIFKNRIEELKKSKSPDFYSVVRKGDISDPDIQRYGDENQIFFKKIEQEKTHLFTALTAHVQSNNENRAEKIEHSFNEFIQTIEPSIKQALQLQNNRSKIVNENAAFKEILSIIRSMNSTISHHQLLIKILDFCIAYFSADRGAIVLIEKNGKSTVKVCRNNHKKDIEPFKISKTIISKIIYEKKPILIQNITDEKQFSKTKSIADMKIKSIVCTPLENKSLYESEPPASSTYETVFGMIYLDSQEINYEIDHTSRQSSIDLLQVIADQTSVSIVNSLFSDTLHHSHKTLKAKLSEVSNELTKHKRRIRQLEANNRLLKIQEKKQSDALTQVFKESPMHNSEFAMNDCIDDVLLVYASLIEKYKITIDRYILEEFFLTTSRSKLMAVLMIVIKNAIDTVESLFVDSKILSLAINRYNESIILIVASTKEKLNHDVLLSMSVAPSHVSNPTSAEKEEHHTTLLDMDMQDYVIDTHTIDTGSYIRIEIPLQK